MLHQLESICDSYLFLNEGRIVEKGAKQELEDKYLKEISLLVETGLNPVNSHNYKGYPYNRKGSNTETHYSKAKFTKIKRQCPPGVDTVFLW